jgi:transcriptional regulator
MFSADLKRGSMELLILSLLTARARHGYEIGRILEQISGGQLEFRVSTLYSTLYRMEERGWVKGRWVEKKGERRRCFYSLTKKGQIALDEQKETWNAFAAVVHEVIGGTHA